MTAKSSLPVTHCAPGGARRRIPARPARDSRTVTACTWHQICLNPARHGREEFASASADFNQAGWTIKHALDGNEGGLGIREGRRIHALLLKRAFEALRRAVTCVLNNFWRRAHQLSPPSVTGERLPSGHGAAQG
jgi:hypothetical protein